MTTSRFRAGMIGAGNICEFHVAAVKAYAAAHPGEVELIGEDVGGIAVHVAARIAALAEGRSVLVSRTVRDLVTGSGIEFDPFGRHSLKGVAEEWDVYTVTGTPLSASSPD